MSDTSRNPQQIRQTIRQRRTLLTTGEQRLAAASVCRQVTGTPAFMRSRNIAAYFAVDGEMSPDQVVQAAWKRNKSVYMPVLTRSIYHPLAFAHWTEDGPLQFNRFGIPEPDEPVRHWKGAAKLDLVIVPLVAFDQHCARIGMGGGFYDRSLSFLQHRQQWRRPFLLGVAYEFQKTATIETRSWDIPLDMVVTEQRCYTKPARR